MQGDHLAFNVRHERVNGVAMPNNIAIVDLHGELCALAAEALDGAFARARQQRSSIILLNFGGVSTINSAGIALIIGLLMQATRAGLRLMACGLTQHDVRVFELARLSEYIRIFPDEANALSSVGKNKSHMSSQLHKEEQWPSQM